ncbi:MAG: CpaF family protein [Bacilli bacterium]|nr:CpaF family protein [Bacilli bacterium]
MNDAIFSQIDFGPIKEFLQDDNVTDIEYNNGGQIYIKTLDKGVYRVERPEINNTLIEKLAFQCSNVMGKSFNMAHPFLDAESAELRLNFIHESIATNGIAVTIRKTPAKIRLNKDKLLNEKYVTENLLDFLITCVKGHCNIIVSGETGSGKTELVKFLASHTAENEKLITIEDTLELHLDRIYPHRSIVAMKTNNIADYADVLVTCMRQNPRWILLSEVRSAEAVMSVRNSISSGHCILSTIHSDRAANIPMRMYSLLESNLDIDQFLKSIHRYVQIGIHVKGYMSAELQRFQREIVEVCEFYVDDNNEAKTNVIFRKNIDGTMTYNNPTKYIRQILGAQGIIIKDNLFVEHNQNDETFDSSTPSESATTKENNVNETVDAFNSENNINPINKNPAPTINNVAPAANTAAQVQMVNSQPNITSQNVMPNITNPVSQNNVNNSEFNFNDSVDNL